MSRLGPELDSLDYYALLEIAPDASADDIQRAFHAFAVRFHPDRHAGELDELRERAAEIYRRGAEAYRVLCDAERRRLYEMQRSRGLVRFDPEQARASRPPSRAPGSPPPSNTMLAVQAIRSARARPLAAKALEALKAGNWAVARLHFQLALQHEPGNAFLEERLAEVETRARAGK
jgi:curved DNA-binding protein CbpA